MSFMNDLRMRYRITIALVLPTVGLIMAAGIIVYDKLQVVRQMEQVEQIAQSATAIGTFVHEMQRERGASAVFIGSRGTQLVTELPAQRQRTDETRRALEAVLAPYERGAFGDRLATLAKEGKNAVAQLGAKREDITGLKIPSGESNAYYTGTIARLLDLATESSKAIDHKDIVASVTSYISFLQAKERSGQERATGAPAFAAGKFDAAQYRNFIRVGADQATYFRQFYAYATAGQKAHFERVVSGDAVKDVERMRGIALDTGPDKPLNTEDGAYWFKQTTVRIDLMKQVEDFLAKELINLEKNVAAAYYNEFLMAAGLSLGIILVTMLFAGIMVRGIEASLGGMTEAMGRLAKGELDVAVPSTEQRDEIGAMARAVEIFKDSMKKNAEMTAARQADQERREKRRQAMEELIHGFEATVTEIVKSVSGAADKMQHSAEAMSGTAEETTRQATAVAAASEEASTNVQTVASATEELSTSVQEISRQVGQSTSIAGKAVDEAKRTDHTVSGLAEGAQKIGEVVELIRTIASQTNLLALNATIEAARAGDAGKGFAVVASEVKNLANQTAKATEDITEQIASIQAATSEAVTAIKGIGATINEINTISGSISAAVQQQGAATQEIARNVQQAAAGTQEVSSNISGVTEAARSTGKVAQDVLGAAKALTDQSENFRRRVDGFLEKIRAA